MEKRRFLILACAAILSACGGGGDSITDLSGIWRGGGNGQVNGQPVIVTVTVTLAQNGQNVTGSFASSSGGTGAITGTFDGSKFIGDMSPSNPSYCPSHFIWFYSTNKLEGSVTTFNCTGSAGGIFTLTR